MTDLTLYGLKNCDTCKKALKALETAGKSVTFVDIRAEADLPAELPGWLDATGADTLVNKRSTTWRNLDETTRSEAQTNAATLLSANPTLIKRPVIEASGEIYVGWTKAVETALT